MADEKGFQYKEISPRAEEEVLLFWEKNKIFEKSLEQRRPSSAKASEGKQKTFVFYEGPPYANGLPGIHHVESRSFKDIVLRYKTMCGFYVPRRAGWDTHGLPTEMEVEKKLGINSKREIEEKIGVEKFVQEAKKSVFTYKEAWEKLTRRMAYWLDLENAYVTMTNNYIEALWHIVSEISKKGLLYEDYRVLPWCTRCQTSLSSHELSQGYRRIKEESIYVRFPIKQQTKNYKLKTSFLVWTTTPWTLPGNVALAVNPKATYVTVQMDEAPNRWLILAEERLSVLSGAYKIINREKGKNLVGIEYEGLYPAIASYKVMPADFVSTEEGTGVVHIAPAFGAEDLAVGKENNLPTLITVNEEGKMIAPGKVWDGKFIREASPLIVSDLEKRSLLFKRELYEHDYPFCWRCETPLIYYAKNSWFFKTTEVKNLMLKENSKIKWHPEYLKEGRFGEWLRENVDWSISRERFWGAPLPIWRCERCKDIRVVGSLKELDKLDPPQTELIVMRHGEATHNLKDLWAVLPELDSRITLTENGKQNILQAAPKLIKENIDMIISSPSLRCKETAELVSKALEISDFETMPEFYDRLVSEVFDGKPVSSFNKEFSNFEEHFYKKPAGSENLRELRARVMRGVFALVKKHPGKKILVITHGAPSWVLFAATEGYEEKDYRKAPDLYPGEFKKLRLHNWPFNSGGELDLHKPYIDEIKLKCKCGGEMTRVKEVIDVWFDSGAMPFAAKYYPKLYPADYITEGIDQTRGWFYTLLAVSSLLDLSSSYRRVLSLGLVLDEKGEKMSKSKGNVADPIALIEKYGADAVRWYFYTVNQPWDDKLFREEEVAGAARRFLLILWNSYKYWETYRGQISNFQFPIPKPKLIINKWVLAKWQEVLKETADKLEAYNIVGAARLIENFVVEDVSHWYIRRIREEMKSSSEECSLVLRNILLELSKALAPFTPFIVEGIYKGAGGEKESVHLEDWPIQRIKTRDRNAKLLEKMDETRNLVSAALEERQKQGVKIRQPLNLMTASDKFPWVSLKSEPEYLNLAKEEVNVKDIVFSKLPPGKLVEFDLTITPELREEGLVREFIRQVQDFRKELKLKPQEKALLSVSDEKTLEKILKKHSTLIKKEISLSDFKLGSLAGEEKEIQIEDKKLKIGIKG